MAFNDNPNVDDNSKRSDESVHVAKGLFSRKNGFITREEFPDYGVDLDVELIDENSGATSKKFGIQIKSTSDVKVVVHNESSFISLPFKTSRLRYLVEREPAYGLILIYDEIKEEIYFDYVEEIINRLCQIKEDDSWREQNTVNILIPLQSLKVDTVRDIHAKFTQRFKNHSLLIKSHGKDFNIPNLTFTTEFATINHQEDKVLLLEQYGSMLFNENEYGILSTAIESLTTQQINSSSEILFIAALLYSYTGKIIEGQYYVQKAKQVSSHLSEEKIVCLEFAGCYVEFAKGNVTHADYLKLFNSNLDNPNLSESNKLLIKINSVWFKFLDNHVIQVTSLDSSSISDLLSEIECSKIDINQKYLFQIYVYEIYYFMALNYFLKTFTEFKLKDSLKIAVPLEERINETNRILTAINEASEAIFNIYNYSLNKFKFLNATAAHALCKNFLSFRTAIYTVDFNENLNFNHSRQYERHYNFGVFAYSIYFELGLYQNAYESICQLREIVELCELTEGTKIGTKTKEELNKIIMEMSTSFGFKPAVSSIIEIANSKKESRLEKFSLIDDDVLRQHAEKIRIAYGLPEERSENIYLALKVIQTFELKNRNPQIELLEDRRHELSPKTHYATPSLFIIRHKVLGIESKPSSDINYLLEQFSTILKT
ncbi:DUF4365 domain-containing protein [Sphingobacterium multivorum]|uniref:DUF4365 domain-containing protein n=1 Tax=Sphingobacterium multivorum TaxID=28454 RepID=UPI00191A3BF2|nr:DUF4365 domain-containing protein [Sphingobacterium multivorum]QQT61216.1 DUF4365 domain-containing protein [Sphingobacterium multivorum]